MSTADDSFDYIAPDLTVFGPDSAYNLDNPLVGNTGTNPAIDYGTDAGGTLPGDGQGGAGTSTTTTRNADGTVTTVDSTGTPVDTSNSVAAGGSDWAKAILGKAATPAGIASLMALAGSLLGMNKPSASPGWKGVIDPNAYVANRAQIQQPAYEPYSGKPVMGGRQFTDVSYSKPGEAAPAQTVNGVPLAELLAKKGIGSLPKDFGPKENDQAGPLQPGGSFTPKTAPPFIEGASKQIQELIDGKYIDKPTGFDMSEPRAITDDIKPGDQGYQAPRKLNLPVRNQMEGYGGYAMGGVAGLAHGGRYLHGNTDGMADKLDTTIDGTQAAKLSHGEFVIPADVVSHLGNGNSTAGADVLYRMMDRVRKARTGNPKQGKQINPEKFMPGGLASLPAYADGGAVAFIAGGDVSAPGVTANPSGGPTLPSTNESNLSSWAGPGVADYITRGTAIAKEPYQAYQGPLTAGTAPLQDKAFTAASNLQVPASIGAAGTAATDIGNKMGAMSYSPVGSTFDAAAATKYINPYLQASLDPALAEARRQSQITQMANDTKATQAGAFGGTRGALMNAETQRNLGTNLAGITSAGYNTAYDKATAQFNAEEARKAQEAQFGSTFGLNALTQQLGANNAAANIGSMQNTAGIANLNALSGAGATQRGIESEGIAANKVAFEEERGAPMAGILATQKLYDKLPVSTVTSSTATTPAQQIAEAAGQMKNVYGTVDELLYGKKP